MWTCVCVWVKESERESLMMDRTPQTFPYSGVISFFCFLMLFAPLYPSFPPSSPSTYPFFPITSLIPFTIPPLISWSSFPLAAVHLPCLRWDTFRPHKLLLIAAYSCSLVMKVVTLEDGIERIKNDAGQMECCRAEWRHNEVMTPIHKK